MGRIKILIADGSPVYKKLFMQASAEVAQTAEVVYAADILTLWEAIRKNELDIIVVDVELTTPHNIEFIAGIKEFLPEVKILLTATPSFNYAPIFAKAMDCGVSLCMVKPIESGYADNYLMIRRTMKSMMKRLRQGDLTERVRAEDWLKPEPAREGRADKAVTAPGCDPELVVIASSTGGPAALKTILSSLKEGFPVPIIVVQHMPEYFSETMANNLRQRIALKVKVAERGDDLVAGTVYLAPGRWHIKVDEHKRIGLDGSPPVNGVCPSADVLFSSIAASPHWSGVLAVILTGMGNDGTAGVARLKAKHNCFCLAQSERTSTIYGMPRAVIERGLADQILDLDRIAEAINQLVGNNSAFG